jgi:exportin-T
MTSLYLIVSFRVTVLGLSQICVGNKATFEPLLISMSRLAEDISDSSSQKSAFAFLSRCVQVWCQPATAADGQAQGVPGFERFVYERLVPTAFVVLSSPQFNIKDGQMMVVCIPM